MMHIQIDLPAIEQASDGARAAGISESDMLAGLVRMFRWVLVKRTDDVTGTNLIGFFGAAPAAVDRLTASLVSYGHLEARRGGSWRVRGAGRYRRAIEARSKGGKAAQNNLKQYKSSSGWPPAEMADPPASAPAAAGEVTNRLPTGSNAHDTGIEPGCSPGSTPALDPEMPRSRSRDPESPRRDRRESDHEKCLELMEAGREMRCAEMGIEPGPRPDVAPQKANTMIGRAIEACGYRVIKDGEGEYTAHDQLLDLHRVFLKDDAFGRFDKDGKLRDMPWPSTLFLSAGVLARFRRDEEVA